MSTYLPPVGKPQSLVMKLVFFFSRRQFGKVLTPLSVFSARLPAAFGNFYGKVSKLDKKLVLPVDLRVLIREQVASINGCHFCMDAARYFAMKEAMASPERFEALPEYRTSSLFTQAERAALDYASELTTEHQMRPDTFAALSRYYSEREICDIVWLVASEHLYNLSNIGLNIGSDGLCEVPVLAKH
jgi:alkylhydroperoxidase family enzyme